MYDILICRLLKQFLFSASDIVMVYSVFWHSLDDDKYENERPVSWLYL
jgi:hypothetical protein